MAHPRKNRQKAWRKVGRIKASENAFHSHLFRHIKFASPLVYALLQRAGVYKLKPGRMPAHEVPHDGGFTQTVRGLGKSAANRIRSLFTPRIA